MSKFRRRFDPRQDVPDPSELKGKANLEKNDFFALVIAATTVFLPIALLFIGIVAIIVFIVF